MAQKEYSSEKFKKKAEKHVINIIEELQSLGQLSISEDFSKEDKDKIFQTIKKEVEKSKKLFNLDVNKNNDDFSL
tara:strand:- start:96010 stop:96234 length:225 start_codon:yes stop_codon:yes gene_type:complete